MHRRLLVLVLAALTAGPLVSSAEAVTYQVGPNRAHRQLSDVAGLLNPGDIVEVDGNATYGPVDFDRPGTAAQPITIRGIRVNGRRPTLSGSDSFGFTLFMRTRTQQMGYYVVEGFEVTNGSQACIRNAARDVTYRDIKVYNCPRHGLLSHDYNSGNLTIQYAEFTGIGGTYAGENVKHAVYITTSQDTLPGSKCRIEYSYVHHNVTGDNVKARCERNEIYYNWIEGAPIYELELIGPDETGRNLPCHSDVVGNVIIGHHGYPIRMGSDGQGPGLGRYRFANNTIVTFNAASGGVMRHYGDITSIELYNNIIYAAPLNSATRLHRPDGGWVNGSEVITGRNNWMSSNISSSLQYSAGAALIGSSMRGSDPGLTNVAGASSVDPRPVAGSPAVDAGTSNTIGSNQYPMPTPMTTMNRQPPVRLSQDLMTASATVRSTIGPIDLGAFEFGGGDSSGPDAPTNLRITSQ